MNICFIFSVVFITLDIVFTASSDDLKTEKHTSNIPANNNATIQFNPDQQPNGNSVNSFWVHHHRPNSHMTSRYEEFDGGHRDREVLRTPHLLTKLVKTLSYGFNPQMLKEDIDTLEKRRKPVTLIGLKKNGNFPKQIIEHMSSRSAEIAELQSPFNDVSQYWLDAANT